MANLEHFDIKPRATTIAQRQHEAERRHNMLVATVVGSMIIVVVAALFMTMF